MYIQLTYMDANGMLNAIVTNLTNEEAEKKITEIKDYHESHGVYSWGASNMVNYLIPVTLVEKL